MNKSIAVGVLLILASACGGNDNKEDAPQQSYQPLTAENKAALSEVNTGISRPVEASQNANPKKLEMPKGLNPQGRNAFTASLEGTARAGNSVGGSAPDSSNSVPQKSPDALTDTMSEKFKMEDCKFTTVQPKEFNGNPKSDFNYTTTASVTMNGAQCPATLSAHISMNATATGMQTQNAKANVSMKFDASIALTDPELIAQNDVSKLDANFEADFAMNMQGKVALMNGNAKGGATIVSAKYGTVSLALGGSGQIALTQGEASVGTFSLYERWTFADFVAETKLEINGSKPENWTCTLNGEVVTSAEEAKKYSMLCQVKFGMLNSHTSSSGQSSSLPTANPEFEEPLL